MKPSITLTVRGLGHVISFKNNKMLTRGRLITDPKKQKWMKRCVLDFVCQLTLLSQTSGYGTSPECLKQFAIASLPLDDNWQELEIGKASCRYVRDGTAGATITINMTNP